MNWRALAVLGFFWAICGSAIADEYGEAISAAFPGFRIVQPSERWLSKEHMSPEDYEKARKAPAVVVGRFNEDRFKDFAAYILDPASKKRSAPQSPDLPDGLEVYSGGLVMCFGQGDSQYRCQRPLPRSSLIYLPHSGYLERIPPRTQRCPGLGRIRPWEPQGSKRFTEELGDNKTIRITTDALALRPMIGNDGLILVFQPDGSFLECSFD